MLSPRFTAKEAMTVSTQAEGWLNEVDAKITDAILEGQLQVSVMLYDANVGIGELTEIGKLFYKARHFFVNHYIGRGFIVEPEGRYITIKWSK